jgi:hypothetical protein
MYASFLEEASELFGGDKILSDASKLMLEVGDEWREFALAIAKSIKSKNDIDFEAISNMLWLEIDWSMTEVTFPFAWPGLSEHSDKTTTYLKMVLDAYGGQGPDKGTK